MVKTKTKIGALELKNPVMPASGTFGQGEEYAKYFDINTMGALVTKTITLNPRAGNPAPRIAETACGMLNAIGIENKGLDYFLTEQIKFLKTVKTAVIASISAASPADFALMARKIEETGAIHAVEVNLSCPNLGHKPGKMAGQDTGSTERIISEVRKAVDFPIIAKLTPSVSDITEIAKSAEGAGADALALINSFPAMGVNIETRKPLLGNITGGLSGPAIKPIALKMVWDTFKQVKIPIIGIGGIMNADDAIEFMLCGASAIQAGTVNFVNPCACADILQGIEEYLAKHKIKDINDIIGGLVL
jgi:dihydroorotate dehydrogenase (NAD+) catalytic subunit